MDLHEATLRIQSTRICVEIRDSGCLVYNHAESGAWFADTVRFNSFKENKRKDDVMKTLPNGITIWNATPHPIRFWKEGWDTPVEVETDEVISATISEETVSSKGLPNVEFVTTEFLPQDGGWHLIEEAYEMGADLIVGSIIAAQAYPGDVVAMTPSPGYERVPPNKKRMNPDKFTTF